MAAVAFTFTVIPHTRPIGIPLLFALRQACQGGGQRGLAALQRHHLTQSLLFRVERLAGFRVELRASSAQNLGARGVESLRRAIGTVSGDRIERIDYREQARAPRNRLAPQTRGYPVPS